MSAPPPPPPPPLPPPLPTPLPPTTLPSQGQQQLPPPPTHTLTYQQQVQIALRRPCVALSVNIMLLYKEINNKYCRERRLRGPGPKYNEGYDDKNGHYVVVIGEEIFERYTVQKILGKGSFGTVVRCFDEKYQEPVAMKIIRSGAYFYNQGALEVDILMKLNSNEALESLVVRLRKVFMWQKHLVLVFDLLSFNLYQLLGYTSYNGVSLDLTRKFAYQLLQVLRHLETHKPPIIHCDLKPENVLLRDQNRSIIRVIDFGSACYEVEGLSAIKYIQSRFYRAPEVILELGYTTAIDRWSLGCMLVELHTGVPLFGGKNESDQISRFTGVLGSAPEKMIRASPKRDVFYCELVVGGSDSWANNQATTAVGPPTQGQTRVQSPQKLGSKVAGTITGGPAVAAGGAVSSSGVREHVWGPVQSASNPRPKSSGASPHQPKSTSNAPKKADAHGGIGASASGSTTQRTASTGSITAAGSRNNGGVVPRPATTISTIRTGSATLWSHGASSQRTRSSHGSPLFHSVHAGSALGGGSGGGSGSQTQRRGASIEDSSAPRRLPAVSASSSSPTGSTVLELRNPPPHELRRSLKDILGVTTGGPRGCRAGQPGHDEEMYSHFHDLVSRLLQYDPAKRISCAEALRHPFLQPLLVLEAQAAAQAVAEESQAAARAAAAAIAATARLQAMNTAAKPSIDAQPPGS